MSLVDSAKAGDRLKALEDLRDLLARTIVATESARDVAALSRQLTDVLAKVDEAKAAKPEQKGTVLDEVNARRADRAARTKIG
jgi:hypothetical protein